MMDTQQAIPDELQERVRRELEPGEAIRWMEQPIPKVFAPAAAGLFLFAIPWTAFVIFWICGASGFERPDFSGGGFGLFPLFGIPFVLVGFGMLLSPVWFYRKALKTVYVVTNRRAITFDAGWTLTVRSYTPDLLRNAYRKEKRNGTGSVILGQRVWADSDSGQRQTTDVGFMNIREPQRVERMLRELVAQGPAQR